MLSPDLLQMLLHICLNFLVIFILVHFLYFPKSKQRNFYFTFMIISLAIFLLVYYMMFALEDMKSKTSMGIGIGLFGIFSIMRYRTDAMPVREMTYLFVVVALSVVNAIGANIDFVELLAANFITLAMTLILEKSLKIYPTKIVQYDRIELITPEKRDELIADLEKRLGLKVSRVEIGAVDFLRDMAVIKVFYYRDGYTKMNSVDHKIKLTRDDLSNV